MEDPIIPVSVKAMMGRFENITNEPRNCRPYQPRSKVQRDNVEISKSQISFLENNRENFENINNESNFEDRIQFQNRNITRSYDALEDSKFSRIDANSDNICENKHQLYENVNDTFYNKNERSTRFENRSRSHSVGSLISHHDDYRDDELNHSNNSNSFTDKQKLVESIVMNIKNSGKNIREIKGSNKNKATAPLLTSKLEKDLRNALEKGVRKMSVRRGKGKDKSPELNTKSNSCQKELENNNPTDGSKIFKRFNSQKQPSGLNTTTKPVSSVYVPSARKYSPSSEPLSSPTVSSGGYVPLVSSEDTGPVSLGGHCHRSSIHSSLREPIRPPRRKSPKKVANENSESVTKNKAIKYNVDPLYSSIPDLKFESPSPLSDSEPPKKPPRTFAHDIYMSTKQEDKSRFQNRSLTESTERLVLNQEQIDALYAKPNKKNKPKNNENELTPHLKPEIAPKPSVLVNSEAKKRFSIVETPSNSKEFLEAKKAAVKRNSSFRFSFRKPKKSSTYHGFCQPQPNSPKKDHRAHNLYTKKDDGSKKVTFSQRSQSDELIYDDDRIYATPNEDLKLTENEPELHYMCSPLFTEDDDDWSTDTEDPLPTETNLRNESPQKTKVADFRTKFGLGGLKQEWRQSYRFIQKRFKSLAPPDKNM